MSEHRENIYLANMAYLAYGQVTENKNFRGEPMPDFDALPEKTQGAWVNAVKAVRRRVVKMGMTAEAESTPKARTIDEDETYMVCPQCGHYPLSFSGDRTLTLKFKNGKAYCQKCMYEREL